MTDDFDDEFDLFSSKTERDRGLDLVADHAAEWMERYLIMVRRLPTGWTGIAERFREMMGEDRPHDPHAWGAATNVAIRERLLEPTGRYLSMSAIKSHARKSPEYRRT